MNYATQPQLRTDWLWPQQLTTPQQPQNLLRPTWKGYGTLSGCAGCSSDLSGLRGLGSCGIGCTLGNALAGLGRAQMRRATLGQVDEADVGYRVPRWLQMVWGAASLISGPLGAYHGYKRHGDSVWGGIGWFFLGAWFWPISMPIAYAQGFARRK